MMRISKAHLLIIPLLAVLGGSLLTTNRAMAAGPVPKPLMQFAACNASNNQLFGFPSWDACLPRDPKSNEIVINDLNDLWLIVIPIIESLIRAAGYVAVGFIIWGSILFIKSQGNAGNITAARDTIRDALIGLVICITSVALIQFVASKF